MLRTGRRPIEIRELTGKNFEIYGVDISENMIQESNARGLKTQIGDITSLEFDFDQNYDCITTSMLLAISQAIKIELKF